MKLNLINKNKLKKIGHRIALMATTITLAATGLVGCGNKEKPQKTTTTTVSSNFTSTTDSSSAITLEPTESVTESNYNYQTTEYRYTQENWNKFKEGAWSSIQGKINNVNQESFNSALLVFNLDYLSDNNIQIVYNEFAEGIDVENELNQAYIVLSQIREYNTTINKAEELDG